jgi:uncharacterized membrane protein YidH (DUF202 family)
MTLATIILIIIIGIPLLLVVYGYAFTLGVIWAIERKLEMFNRKIIKNHGKKERQN